MVGQLQSRLLLVEDDLTIRKLIARHLLAAGYVLRTADDGFSAIAKLRAGLPDLIISDLHMPGMSGFEFLKVVRHRFPQLPVIAISSLTKDEITEVFTADAFCIKNGSDFQEFPDTVAKLMHQPSPRTARPAIGEGLAKARWDGASRHVVRCGDYLREFAVARVFIWVKTTCGQRAYTAAAFLKSFLTGDKQDPRRGRVF